MVPVGAEETFMMLTWVASIFLLGISGYFLFRRSKQPSLLVFVFEKIGTPPSSSKLKEEWISEKFLQEFLSNLSQKGFTPLSLTDLNSNNLPAKPVLLAFLGGYQSFMQKAFPLLQNNKQKAALFLAPEPVGTYNSWQNPQLEPWQNTLTKAELHALQESKLLSFGTLGLTGDDLTALPKEDLLFSFQESLYRLENQMSIKPTGIALWPNSRWNKKIEEKFLYADLKLPLITSERGINKGKVPFLKIICPAESPLRARWQLFKHR